VKALRHASAHERRTTFLEGLADLLGCTERLDGILPDGRRPDVLALDSRREILFIGEAKDTETPGARATQARLQGYLRWLAGHATRPSGVGVCAVCFGREADGRAWLETLVTLAKEASVPVQRKGLECFGRGVVVAWAIAVRSTRASERGAASGPSCGVQGGDVSSMPLAGPRLNQRPTCGGNRGWCKAGRSDPSSHR